MSADSTQPHLRVLAFGWYGAGNVGDELLLRMLIDWCGEAGAQLTALSTFPHHTRSVHGIRAVDAFDVRAVAECMLESDLFVLGGGGLFQTHHEFTLPGLYDHVQGDIAGYARPLLMARQMGVPTLLWAQGLGPLEGDWPRQIVKEMFSHASRASVRDEASSFLLRELGVDRDFVVAPDPVWALPVEKLAPAPGRKQRIGLVLREWSLVPGWEDALVGALRSAASPEGHSLVWLPFQAGEADGTSPDLALVEALGAVLEDYEQETLVCNQPLDAVDALRDCDRVVCMRLHAQILCLKLGKPLLCLEYDEKMGRVSEMVELQSSARLRLSAPLGDWHSAFAAFLDAGGTRASSQRLDRLQDAALAHKRVLHEAIEDSRGRDKSPSWKGSGFDWVGSWSDDSMRRAFARREARLAEQLARRDARLDALSESLGQRDNAVAVADQAVALLRDALQHRDSELVRARAETDDAKQQLGRQLAEREQERGAQEQQLQSLRSQLSASAGTVESLNRELAGREAREQELVVLGESYLAQIGELRAEIERREFDEAAAMDEILVRDAAIDELAREVAYLRSEHELVARERARIEGLLVQRTNERDRILASSSWRLTRPLRVARALLFAPMQERKQLLRRLLGVAAGRAPRTPLAPPKEPERPQSHPDSPLDWLALANGADKVAIIPSAFEFEELANQRPINLAKFLAGRGYTVVFAAWQWSRGEQLLRSNREVHPGVWQIDLYALIDQAQALARRVDAGSAYFITLPAPELVDLHRALRRTGMTIVYDIMDDWQEFHAVGQAPWYAMGHEREAVMAADVVAAVSPPLQRKFASLRNDVRVIGNGHTPEMLGLDNRFCASHARELPQGPFRIGYFGHLTDAWFDWPVVLEAAKRLKDRRFEIIGYGAPPWAQEAAMQLPNVELVGKVAPGELWKHARSWHVALAPFKPGPLAEAIDPIKAYEYIYFGLPIVCTGIPHLAGLPGVTVARDLEELIDACRKAIDTAPDYDAMDVCLRDVTWAARFEALMAGVGTKGLRELYVS